MLNPPKDNFSAQAKGYSQYRPSYPAELYEFIFKHVQDFDNAWDCATGNGQAAVVLANTFTNVYATDISQKQLDNAVVKSNIHYAIQRAEETTFADGFFSLITIAQALHWFNFEMFNKEAKRVLKPSGVIAAWGYDILSVSPEIDSHFLHFYHHTTAPYWDPERRIIDEHYINVPFPFQEIAAPEFKIVVQWGINEFKGYLNTWSGVQKYIAANNINPVDELIAQVKPFWPDGEKLAVTFPVFLRLGINK